MSQIIIWLKKLFALSSDEMSWEERFRSRLFFLLISLTVPSFLIFGIIHIIDRDIRESVSNLITAAFLGILLFLFLRRKNRFVVFFLSSLVITLSLSLLFYIGGDQGSRLLWFYFIPVSVGFLIEMKWAKYFIIFSYFVIAVVYLNIPILGFPPYNYEPAIKARFLMTYSLIVLFAVLYSYIHSKYRQELKHENEKLQEANNQIFILSITDPLTKCNNRNYFTSSLEKEVSRSLRYKDPLSIIMCDIDFFKHVNDYYGHGAGDEVLIGFASILLSSVREKIDSVYRVGGEEFVIILPQTGKSGACILAERIHANVGKNIFVYKDIKIQITASFGVITMNPDEGKTVSVDSLLTAVDSCLYEAKNNGRDQIVYRDAH